MMMQDALPSVKSFFRKAKFTDHAQDFVLRMIIAFMFHIGRMSASQGAVAIRTSVRHRAQVTRFLHGSGLANGSEEYQRLAAAVIDMESRRRGRCGARNCLAGIVRV